MGGTTPYSLFGLNRSVVIQIMGWMSAIAAALSALLAIYLRPEGKEQVSFWGYVLLGFWAIAPPVWFLVEYSFWPPADKDENERTRHLHDLARNIWLAFIVVIATIMGVKWPLG